MNRDHVVFTICGFVLGLIIGSFLIGPKLAQSKLAGNASVEAAAPEAGASEAAAPTAPPAANAAGGASPMEAVKQQLDNLKQQIAQDPKNFAALVQLANMYMDVGKYPQAIDYYQRALAVREEPAVRTDLGICFKESSQPEKAIAEFTRVASEQPGQWQAVYNLAIIYAETKRIDQARAEIAKLKQMNADPAQVAKLEEAVAGK